MIKLDGSILATRYLSFLLRRKRSVAFFCVALTVVLGYFAARTRVYTDFFDLYPPKHPYIQTYKKYREVFGTANVLAVIVERKHGTIYTRKTIEKVDRITRLLMETRGVDPLQVVSLTHPRVKTVEITGTGIATHPVVDGLPKSDEEAHRIREVVYRSPEVRGFYVSPDDTATAIFAGFWEEGADLGALFDQLQNLQARETDDEHTVYVTGYPMLFGWFAHYLWLTYVVMLLTVATIAALLWFYFRTWVGVWVPLVSAGLSALWAIGFAGLLGFTLDPLALVIFLLITARGLSHSVQSVERYHLEYRTLGDKDAAISASCTSLFVPAMTSILSDGLAILTLATASIALLQKIAFVSAFWVVTIALSVVTLHPVLLSYLGPPVDDPRQGQRWSDRIYEGIISAMCWSLGGRRHWFVLLGFAGMLVGAIWVGRSLQVGDTTIGKALLDGDHPYNKAFDVLNNKFVGSAELVIVAEGDRPAAIQDEKVLTTLDSFQRYMEIDPHAGGSASLSTLVKRVNRMYHEGEPRWEIIPEDPGHIGEILFLIAMSSTKAEVDRLFGKEFQHTTVKVYYRDYALTTVTQALERAKKFISGNPLEHVTFHLAGGLVGILAAVNEEVESSKKLNLYLVLGTVFVLSFIAYRSVLGALIVMAPSLVAQPVTDAFMYLTGIDMNINSLPVAAVGIGIGVDYGYYILSRMEEEFGILADFDTVGIRALRSTGKAVLFTATALTGSVFYWLWFPMKFQADMALLLIVTLTVQLVGALLLIPALVKLVRPRFLMAEVLEHPEENDRRICRVAGGVESGEL